MLEAKSLWTKQVNAGYCEDQGNIVSCLLPMLAHDYTKRGKDIQNECYVQPKLDGVRMLAKYDGTLFSRTGKEYQHLDHIALAVKSLSLPRGTYVDGELFTFELPFEEITGTARKTKKVDPKVKLLKFHIFDMFNTEALDTPFTTRYETLSNLDISDPLVLVPTVKTTKDEVISYHDTYAQESYEGVMIRNPNGVYKIDHRSADLQKYKVFTDAEYTIADVKEAIGEDRGTAVFVCTGDNGIRFSVRPKGTRATRAKYLQNAHEYLGKRLTVKYQNLSEAGVPRFPVGLAIRDYD